MTCTTKQNCSSALNIALKFEADDTPNGFRYVLPGVRCCSCKTSKKGFKIEKEKKRGGKLP